MSESYDAKLCEKIHERVDERLDNHEKRINGHSDRLDKLEQRGAAVDTKIESLCEQIKNLVNTLKWGFGIIVTITLFVLGYLIKIR
ncbi:MAG: hemolysin XhlA family protein [Bacillota bacterium]|nr:hemolysin XhlA family protein [Bacillota bacterium]